MKILQIPNYDVQNNQVSLSFRSTNRAYYDKTVKDSYLSGIVSNYTFPFRDDFDDWFGNIDFILNNFKNKKNINIYSLGCSDGSEPYSIGIALIKSNMPDAKKVRSIIATDIDRDILELAKSGKINLSYENISRIKELLGENQDYFYDEKDKLKMPEKWKPSIRMLETDDYRSYKVKEELFKMIKYREENILETVNSIKDDSNTFVACRNTIPYLSIKNQKLFLHLLSLKLKKNSMVAIGEFDKQINLANKLMEEHFAPTKIRNLFIKL